MSFGLDYITGPSIADMKAAKVEFVCRYVGYTSPGLPQEKILTQGEAKANIQAGISIVSNWEWYEKRCLEGFDAGVWDAQTAHKNHVNCGGPPDRPIYFSVDIDVLESQVADYFKGIASVIGLARTGAYGEYGIIKDLFNAGLITWGWQTYAWSAGLWEPRAHIQQYQNSMMLGGQQVDFNRSIKTDFGQWGVTMSDPNTLAKATWDSSIHLLDGTVGPLNYTTGIAQSWHDRVVNKLIPTPPPTTGERRVTIDGIDSSIQEFGAWRCVWNHVTHAPTWIRY